MYTATIAVVCVAIIIALIALARWKYVDYTRYHLRNYTIGASIVLPIGLVIVWFFGSRAAFMADATFFAGIALGALLMYLATHKPKR